MFVRYSIAIKAKSRGRTRRFAALVDAKRHHHAARGGGDAVLRTERGRHTAKEL